MFTDTRSMKKDSRVVALVYGPPKIGKTTLAKTLPGKQLIINFENGLLSLQDESIDVYDCTVDKNGNIMSRDLRFEKLVHLFTNVLSTAEMKKKYSWLVIDSITEVGQCLVEAMKKKHPNSSDALKMWGEYSEKITDLIKQMRDYKPYNVLFLALEATDKDEQSRRFTGVDLNGKISQRIPALVDEIFHYRVFVNDEGQEKRFLVTSEHERAVAGDRSGKLDKFETPNMKSIVEKISKPKGGSK